MLEGKGKIVNRPTQTGKKLYNNYFVHIPTAIARDSAFPFRIGEEVIVTIDTKEKKLVIRRVSPKI